MGTRSARDWLAALVGIVATVWFSPEAMAWGKEGHQIIAYIAAQQLSPKAREGVAALLGGDAEASLVEVSTWADDIKRSRRDTGPWHYVDIPISAPGYDAGRDCPNGECVVAQIDRDLAVIADKRLAAPVRAEALRFLIHFVGDIHQPLHTSNNDDRGGNEIRVYFGRRRTNLHALWDTPLVEQLGRDPFVVATSIEAKITADQKSSWSKGRPVEWANETHSVARQFVYSDLSGRGETRAPIILLPDYGLQKAPVVRTQLARAGTRLAWVLNRVFR